MKSKNKINYIWFAPIITLGILLVLYAVADIFPFGANTSAFSDAVGQYVPMLAEFTNKIREGSSLFFTWHAGRGSNFLAIISYYLASPLNLIALLFKTSDIDNAFSVITILKPVLMALTFGIYLKHTYKKNDLSVVIFSVLWAFSGFIVGSFFFVSWMDSIIYFPLVILGLKKLMDGESGWFYALFLGLTIISNFYIGWMVCIFCVIYFVYSFIADDEVVYDGATANNDETDDESTVNIFAVFKNSYLLNSCIRFACASLLAGAFSAILALPAAGALQQTLKGTTHTDSIIVNTNIWGLLASHIIPFKNVYDSLGSTQCIFAFCGIMTVILCVAYFFAKGISKRKKAANAFLLIVFWASMWIYPLSFAWHGFGEPYGIMYRFAFLYSFVLLKIAFEAFCEIKTIPIYGFIAGIIMCAVDIFAITKNALFNTYFSSAEYLLPIIVFTIIFTVVLILLSKDIKGEKAVSVVLLFAIVLETGVLNRDNINHRDLTPLISERETVEEFSKDLPDGEYLAFAKKDTSFNDIAMYGMLFNNNDNSTYSSLANGDFTLAMACFGCYGNGINAVDGAKEQTPIFNLLFPTKYYLDGTENLSENSFRKIISSGNGYTLYENDYTMPFMYTIAKTIDEWDPFAYLSPADDQNAAFKYITNLNKDVLSYNEVENISYENCKNISNLDRLDETGRGQDYSDEYYEFMESKMLRFSTKITDTTKPAYITISSKAQNDGIMYLYVDVTQFTDLTITVNGVSREYTAFGVGENRTYEIGEVNKDDVVTVKLGGYRHEKDAEGNIYPTPYEAVGALCYTVDMDIFREGYNKLDAMSDTEMLEFEDTYVKAKVISYEDGMLYIPTAYDEGWTITIDGEEVPLYEHESHILMTEISKGEHIVEMKYVPQGFIPGAVITGVSVLILVAWAVISIKRLKKEQESDIIASNDVNEE